MSTVIKKIAYLIFAHQHSQHFIRLLKKLDTPESIFIVHIDARQQLQPFKEVEKFIEPSKIIWLKQKKIVWAGFNSIKVTLDGLKEAANAGHNISHVTFISGQDYLIKPVKEYHEFLAAHENKSFVENAPLPRPGWANGGLDRIGYYHLLFPSFRVAFPLVSYLKIKLNFNDEPKWKSLKKILHFIPAAKKFPRRFLHQYTPYEGSNWFTLCRKHIIFLLEELEKDAAFYNFFKYTHHADEIFFQTLLINRLVNVEDEIVNENVTHVIFDPTTGRPFLLEQQHFKTLKDSAKFFARKFDPGISADLLQEIDEKLLKQPIAENVYE